MGNCIFRAFKVEGVIKVITSNGGVMELYPPITAECITNEFPGHAIFRTLDLFSQPLLHSEELTAGESYHLLPIRPHRGGIMRDNSDRKSTFSSLYAPYRMTFDNHGNWRSTQTEVVPKYNSAGVWKVKLVISPEQLTEILSQESRTEALIESVRTVAKCGSGVPSAANSDQWSLGSSWNMGSCIFRASQVEDVIKVITSNGGVMELYPPITAECITNEFPGHSIYSDRACDLFSQPLLHSEELIAGESYHLLPTRRKRGGILRDYSDQKSSFSSPFCTPPYRMSCDKHGNGRNTQADEVPKHNSAGVWKVKLVITPDQLREILSQESRTEALIQCMETVAKCGSGAPSRANSDK
ncbi:UvrABC system protein C [Cinnamomum micranthum f. kanehirae]|uniref:UvrABC system protein C n=1 Tax=Cinnamomum micranthum f. kanehirae TaxID=337451 RepID=A0A443PA60_9MAGN|nr:UvrABC system protein C [Cinnamomum micranthum f. kanehirae]